MAISKQEIHTEPLQIKDEQNFIPIKMSAFTLGLRYIK